MKRLALPLILALLLCLPFSRAETGARELRDALPGDTVAFGRWPQEKGAEPSPIEWLVLERDGDRLTLVSRCALDQRPYNDAAGSVTWETCSLRSWLNGEFFQTAFTPQEQLAVPLTRLENPDNPVYGTPGGNDTLDRVYLLSPGDLARYFSVSPAPGYGWCLGISKDLAAPATRYASAKGAYTHTFSSGDISAVRDNYGAEYPQDMAGTAACLWWLRSPGSAPRRAMYVRFYGNIYADGYAVNGRYAAVRPALAVDVPQ